ncbi:MAG TPA: DUF2231 domain-containing protein [Luteimonas sp.]
MVATAGRRYTRASHPFHVLLLGGSLALFLGALVSDIAYAQSYHIQWQNFASWFIVGGLVLGGAAMVCAAIDLMPARRTRASLLHAVALLAAWIVGFFNALMHARDAWASMPGGLVLSIICFLLACVAAFFAMGTSRTGGVA